MWARGLKKKKGCIHSYKRKRYKLLFSIDISGPCGVIFECWGSHRPGKSLAKQSNSCHIRAGKLGPSIFTVSKFEKVLYAVCINEFIGYSDAAVNETLV